MFSSLRAAMLVVLCLLAMLAASCGGEDARDGGLSERAISGLPPQSSQSGGVTVVVTPLTLAADAEYWEFEITVDSHGPELNEDLAASAFLTAGESIEYAAKDYSGDGPGGHHRQGRLRFDAIRPVSGSLILKVRGVGGVGERSFSWAMSPEP